MFLQGSGSMLAIPFLQSLLPRSAWASTHAPINRYVAVMNSYDIGHISHFFPTLDKPGLSLASPVPGHPALNYAPLSSYLTAGKTSLSKIIGPEFNPYFRQMNVMRGLDLGPGGPSLGHNMSSILGVIHGPANAQVSYQDLPNFLSVDQMPRDVLRNFGVSEVARE